MFYDERIEFERGKISRNCIIIAVSLSLLFMLFQIANINVNANYPGSYSTVAAEAAIALSGMISLAVGLLRGIGKENDEFFRASQSKFYSRAAMTCLKIVLFVQAYIFPVSFGYISLQNAPEAALCTVFLVLGIYCAHTFKKNGIYFNYSIIERENYIKNVFRRVGKLGYYTLILYTITLLSDFLSPILNIKTIGFGSGNLLFAIILYTAVYTLAFIVLALLYLFYSYLEKTSFTNEKKLVSRSSVISIVLSALFSCIGTYIVSAINSLDARETVKVALLSISDWITPVTTLGLAIFITYFNHEYQKNKESRLFRFATHFYMITMIFGAVAGLCFSVSNFTFVFHSFSANINGEIAFRIQNIYYNINVFLSDAVSLAELISISLAVAALIKNKDIHGAHAISIFAFALVCGADLFLRTQLDTIPLSLVRLAINTSILIYCCVVVALVAKKQLENDTQM